MYISEEFLKTAVLKTGIYTVKNILHQRKLKKSEAKLIKLVPNYSIYKKDIEKIATESSKNIVNAIRNLDAKGATNSMSELINKFRSYIIRIITRITKGKPLGIALVLLLLVSLCNELFEKVTLELVILITKEKRIRLKIYTIILPFLAGAFQEELARSIAIEMGAGGMYTIAVNVAEITDYVDSMVRAKIPFGKALIIRLIAAADHTLYYLIQKHFAKYDKPNLGLLLAILLHLSYNLLVSLGIIEKLYKRIGLGTDIYTQIEKEL